MPQFCPRNGGRKSGIALVIVLGFLVLVSALVISFFSNVSTELVSAKGSQAAVSSRQLAESTTNLVISQIADGTAGFKDSRDPQSGVLAWASQPGMIRTYDEEGNAYRYHKLYSAQNMVLTGIPEGYNVNREFERDVPVDWARKPAAYVDLNAPVKSSDGNGYDYPIVNPEAQKTSATARDGVDGFEIIKPPGYSGAGTRPSPTYDPTTRPEANPAPMPVRWLYVLQNGNMLSAPDASDDGKLDWNKRELKPTKDNPIVGRIAFWTDDDTAKININTASEGVFWDRPWSKTGYASDESKFAAYIPGQNEYQRYPGHPAMTCLSPVLGFVMNYQLPTDKGRYYALVPRVMDIGTKAGTQAASDTQPFYFSDNERLFASVDELAFAAPPALLNGARTVPNGIPAARVREFLNKARFFLTANSRAPELNLFNKPRVGLWPLQLDPKERDPQNRGSSNVLARSAKDKLIAFCGTTAAANSNKKALYYFQRYNEYVVSNAKVFGDGRSFASSGQPSSTSPTLDYLGIQRNQDLYAYLQKLTADKVPGFGGSLKAKYDTPTDNGSVLNERDQILTEMMDYIRTNVNAYNTAANSVPQYDYAPTRRGGPVAGETQLVPLVLPNNTKGLGRFATVSEAAVVFTRRTVPASGGTPAREEMNAHLVMELFNPTPGLASWSPHVRYVVKGLERFQVGGAAFGGSYQNMNWANFRNGQYTWNFVTSRVGYSGGGHNMPFMGLWASFRYFGASNSDNTKVPGIGGTESEYPFYTSSPNVITNAGAPGTTTFDLKGGPIQIEIYSGFEPCSFPTRMPSPSNLVQRINMNFPDVTGIPLPNSSGTQTFAERLAAGTNALITGNDTVRSVELRNDSGVAGDPRMLCALFDVPDTYFQPHYRYSTGGVRNAHSLRSEESRYGGDNGPNIALVSGLGYTKEPAAARGVSNAALRTANGSLMASAGDWDNATGDGEDGAYVNKADEGNLATSNGGYFDRGGFNVETGATFSPNRQISSAVAFGSLPTGVKATELAMRNNKPELARPWQTLLFSPVPAAKQLNQRYDQQNKHPGFGTVKTGSANPSGLRNQPPYVTPPDHLFLDLFTMPIVEPYAISEPLSTAGKINLNYQIAPFTYIKRTTGIQGVLRSTKVMAIPNTSTDKSLSRRYDINADVGRAADDSTLDGALKGTLFYFHDKFANGDIFRSASQICDVPLIPGGSGISVSYDNIDSFWTQNRRTGDNVREIPYGHIYPRVTTKSNTYTVHMRVQALRKASSGDPAVWEEGRDQALSEYRGSTSLERYVDAADPTLPDFAKSNVADNVDRHYRFRVIATKAFTP